MRTQKRNCEDAGAVRRDEPWRDQPNTERLVLEHGLEPREADPNRIGAPAGGEQLKRIIKKGKRFVSTNLFIKTLFETEQPRLGRDLVPV